MFCVYFICKPKQNEHLLHRPTELLTEQITEFVSSAINVQHNRVLVFVYNFPKGLFTKMTSARASSWRYRDFLT